MHISVSFTLFTLFCLAALGACATSNRGEPVAVLVEVARPAGVTDAQLIEGFSGALPAYRAVPGLQRKYFTYDGSSFGGVYLWSNRAAAKTFYSADWEARIAAQYGRPATLTWFKAPVLSKGGAEGNAGRNAAVAIVRVPAPWYAPGRTIRSRMVKSVPLYKDLPGLDSKYFTIADGKRIGGIYLWVDQAAAYAFYDETWHKRIVETYGEDADLKFLSAPVTLINTVLETK